MHKIKLYITHDELQNIVRNKIDKKFKECEILPKSVNLDNPDGDN